MTIKLTTTTTTRNNNHNSNIQQQQQRKNTSNIMIVFISKWLVIVNQKAKTKFEMNIITLLLIILTTIVVTSICLHQWNNSINNNNSKHSSNMMIHTGHKKRSSSNSNNIDTKSTLLSPQSTSYFTLLVQLTFSTVQYKNEFIQHITPLCQYIQEQEYNTTISYEVLLSDQNELQVLVFERYIDKDIAYKQIHKSSKEFITFRKQLQVLQNNNHVTISGSSYYDSNIGFV